MYGTRNTKSNVDKIEMVQRRAARFACHDYSRYSHVSTLINALGWESLEQRRLNNQVCMFYSRLVGITLPAEMNPVTRVSRYPNCAPFQQLITLNDTYKYSFYPRTIRIWNNIPLPTIPDSLDKFKPVIF